MEQIFDNHGNIKVDQDAGNQLIQEQTKDCKACQAQMNGQKCSLCELKDYMSVDSENSIQENDEDPRDQEKVVKIPINTKRNGKKNRKTKLH